MLADAVEDAGRLDVALEVDAKVRVMTGGDGSVSVLLRRGKAAWGEGPACLLYWH